MSSIKKFDHEKTDEKHKLTYLLVLDANRIIYLFKFEFKKTVLNNRFWTL